MPVAPKGGNNLLQLAIGDLVRHGRRRRHPLTALAASGSTSNDRRDRDERSCDGEGSPTPPHSPVRSGSPRSPTIAHPGRRRWIRHAKERSLSARVEARLLRCLARCRSPAFVSLHWLLHSWRSRGSSLPSPEARRALARPSATAWPPSRSATASRAHRAGTKTWYCRGAD